MMDGDDMQVVTFGIGTENFAVPVANVREILEYRDVFRIPGGPDYLLGLTQLRGEGITTIDFRLRLGLPRAEATQASRVLVVDVPLDDKPSNTAPPQDAAHKNNMLQLGLVVDRVLDVSSFHANQLEPAPDIGTRWQSDYITAVVRNGDSFTVLINLQAIFSSDEAALPPPEQS